VAFRFDRLAWSGWLGTGGYAPAACFHGTNPTTALVAQPFMVAQTRDVDTGLIGSFHDGLPGIRRDLNTIDRETEPGFLLCAAHCVKSLSKM
jgi:hypothetical protein